MNFQDFPFSNFHNQNFGSIWLILPPEGKEDDEKLQILQFRIVYIEIRRKWCFNENSLSCKNINFSPLRLPRREWLDTKREIKHDRSSLSISLFQCNFCNLIIFFLFQRLDVLFYKVTIKRKNMISSFSRDNKDVSPIETNSNFLERKI